jgi:hypothetical protein
MSFKCIYSIYVVYFDAFIVYFNILQSTHSIFMVYINVFIIYFNVFESIWVYLNVFIVYVNVCGGGTRACFHHLDFQSKNFSYAIFIIKKRPLYVNFSILLCGEYFFWQPSTTLVNMRFFSHVSNSNKYKNMKSGNPCLCPKMVFLASKNTAVLLGRSGKKLFVWLWTLWSRKR